MGCTDTVSTVGSVPGRRVAPGEETQNRVARWEACRRNKKKHTCFQENSEEQCEVPGMPLDPGRAPSGEHSLAFAEPAYSRAYFFPFN